MKSLEWLKKKSFNDFTSSVCKLKFMCILTVSAIFPYFSTSCCQSFELLLLLTTICTGGSPFSMLSGASRGEQKGSLTTGELFTLISVSCSVRSGSNPRGNSLECSSSDPSSPAGGGIAIEARSLDMEESAFLERKTFTSSGYIKEKINNSG